MVGMGRSKDLGQTGPDDAGDALTKTTIRVSGEQMPALSIKSQHPLTTCGSTGLYC